MKQKWEFELAKKVISKKKPIFTRQFTLGENDRALIAWLDLQAKKYECSAARVIKKILYSVMK